MPGRTWKSIENDKAKEIKTYLLANGGVEVEAKGEHEAWRIKFSDSTFTYYQSGTLHSTPSSSNDPAVFDAWKYIDSVVGSVYALPTKDFLIGLDETGKGEVIGHTVLTGIVFPKELFSQIDLIVGSADTKKRHTYDYWDGIFKELDHLREQDFDFVVEKVPPWHVDKYNLNKIIDVSYQRILSIFLRKVEITQCRVVLDDYGIGATLQRFLNFLEKQGAEVVVVPNSESRYLEAKVASLISKREREVVMKAINENKEFQIDDLSVGSGNAGDRQTLEWLKKWHASEKPWPWFVKRSFKTVREIEGKSEKPRKEAPPIREKLLSPEFLEKFNRGKLSIQSLSIVCPSCGSVLKSARLAVFIDAGRKVSELKCLNHECGHFIKNAGITLRYYCGYVIPDSNAIQRNLISNDLSSSRFFENFNVILVPVVRKECDGTPRGKKEFEELWRYSAMGRIRVESPGSVKEVPDNLLSTVRDEKIIEACLDYNAILLTGDKSMSAFAGGKGVFAIFI
jgi:ribonuclease HII